VRIKSGTDTLLVRCAFLKEGPKCSVIGEDSVSNTASAPAKDWHSEDGRGLLCKGNAPIQVQVCREVRPENVVKFAVD
jgi:hypothetical protein